jgi:hypothetical protein
MSLAGEADAFCFAPRRPFFFSKKKAFMPSAMPSFLHVGGAAAVALVFFSVIGWPIARRLLPPGLAHGAAPALGWAVFSALALPALSIGGFSQIGVAVLSLACLALSLRSWAWEPGLPAWCWVVAGAVAMLPALAIMPKYADGGVLLGPPMFDHVKAAIIDQITRQGLPPGNPFFGPAGASPLSYYYLWHFTASVLAEALGLRGWTADAAMTWFTAFSAMLLMMGIAVHVSASRLAAALVALLSIPASLRPVLDGLFGGNAVRAMMPPSGDIGAWVNQASWVPQHLASGCCVVLSALLIAALPNAGRLAVPVLGVVVASGFESSTWVGGVTFAAVGLVLAPLLLVLLPPQARRRFLLRAASAAVIAVLLVSPFLISQAHTVAARGVGFPIALQPYRAFQGAGWLANLLAFWPLVLPFNFPALFPAGALALRGATRQRTLILVLGCCAGACLTVTWLLRSTIENNDLGWRAPIPAILVLTAFAATVWSRWLLAPRRWPIAAAGLLAALGLVQAAEKFDEALHGQQPADAAGFARSEALWEAVRRVAGPDDRVGNNPLMLADLTPWPDDISWALLSNRPSCYAGWASAIAYAGVSRASLAGIDALFQRVFAGHPEPGDVAALATRFDCRVIVLTPADGAWPHDPFAGSTPYRLAVQIEGQWRIYKKALLF